MRERNAEVATIFETADREGRPVALTTDAWAHILERHAELGFGLDEIRLAVEAPEAVTQDTAHRHRANHYRRPARGRAYVKVVGYRPVPPQGAWAGAIVTAYPVERVNPKEPPR